VWRRVRNERDHGRFEARGEQMMRMEHLADRRRWEESMARPAAPWSGFAIVEAYRASYFGFWRVGEEGEVGVPL
jgi:hypothetical protein